jgi:signal transduction histidine kinase
MGVGITGMRERVRELGGEFEIKSSAEGTIVKAVLPIGERSAANALKFESDLA